MTDSRWTTSNSSYGSFCKAVPLQPRVNRQRAAVVPQTQPQSAIASQAQGSKGRPLGAPTAPMQAWAQTEPGLQASALPSREDPAASRRRLSELLKKHGVRERPVRADGNCQFRALADQLYASEEHHAAVREQVIAQLRQASDRYCGFVPGRFDDYVAEMARDCTWGDHVTLQAAADALGVRINLITDYLTDAFIEVLPTQQKSSKVLTLCFWSEVHYNSIAS